jgi:hypothetical protein
MEQKQGGERLAEISARMFARLAALGATTLSFVDFLRLYCPMFFCFGEPLGAANASCLAGVAGCAREGEPAGGTMYKRRSAVVMDDDRAMPGMGIEGDLRSRATFMRLLKRIFTQTCNGFLKRSIICRYRCLWV